MKGKRLSYEKKKSLAGLAFLLPWVLGFLMFFLVPFVESLIYSFNRLDMTATGFEMTYVGFENYQYNLVKDANYVRYLAQALGAVLYQVPLITFFSIFIAMLLNRRMRGRAAFRAIFFLPVIVASGVVLVFLKEDIFGQSMNASQNVYMFQSTGFSGLMTQMGLPYALADALSSFIDQIYSLTWQSGVQILLFLAGLQTIPASYKEAARLEGATEWDMFWKITIPLISPIILLNVVYSVIDTFTAFDNQVMQYIYATGFVDVNYGSSAAQSWIFFLLVSALLALVYRVLGRRVQYIVN